jgi:hypothetical protein
MTPFVGIVRGVLAGMVMWAILVPLIIYAAGGCD